MQKFSNTLLILALIFVLFGGRSYWREYKHRRASVSIKVDVSSVIIKPIRNGLSTVYYTLTFIRDGVKDTLEHKITHVYTVENPLPSKEDLQSAQFFVHYIPESKKSKTPFPNRIFINNTAEYDLVYGKSCFLISFFLILVSYLIKPRMSYFKGD